MFLWAPPFLEVGVPFMLWATPFLEVGLDFDLEKFRPASASPDGIL